MNKDKEALCKECQECCKWLEFNVTVPSVVREQVINFYHDHGCKTKTVTAPFIANADIKVLVPCKCSHLKENGCDIYEDRYEFCKNFDGTKDVFMKDLCKWNQLTKEESE